MARPRDDGFDEERKALFLFALRQGESVLGACRLVGVSNRTAYNHRRSDPDFARDWRLARGLFALPAELLAYQRAVEGTAEWRWVDGELRPVRLRPSDALLATLVEGEQPEKYGHAARSRTHARLKKKVQRLAGRLEAVEARLEAAELRTVRSPRTVNFMNPGEASPKRRRRGERRSSGRLEAVRRRLASGDGKSCRR
jgi:hypothetical protein